MASCLTFCSCFNLISCALLTILADIISIDEVESCDEEEEEEDDDDDERERRDATCAVRDRRRERMLVAMFASEVKSDIL